MLAKQLKMKQKKQQQRDRFLGILLGTLGDSLLEKLLTGERFKTKIPGTREIKAGEKI